MNRNILAVGAVITALQVLPAQAHTLWINVVPEYEKHVIATIGYGDLMPGSEILTPDWGPMTLENYDLVSPDGTRESLGVPKLVTQAKKTLSSGVQLQPDGDNGVRKLILGSSSKKGTYQLTSQTPLVRLTHYVDKQGKKQTSEQPPEKLKDVAEITGTTLEINFMKAAFTVGGWTDVSPLGHPLEIVPLTDLSEARVGDIVRFKVLLNGKAWNPTEGEAFFTGHNMSFGDRWGIYAALKYGEGEFRIPTAGLWRISAESNGQNTDVDAYKSVPTPKGKTLPLKVESSFTFNVKP